MDGLRPAHEIAIIGRRALTGQADGEAVTPADLEQAVGDGRAKGSTFRVTTRKVDGLAMRIEEVPY